MVLPLCTADPFIPSPADYVLPFIGTTNGGHVFPGIWRKDSIFYLLTYFIGATLPHGMVKAGMDTNSPGNVSIGQQIMCTILINLYGHSKQDMMQTRSTMRLAFRNFMIAGLEECVFLFTIPTERLEFY